MGRVKKESFMKALPYNVAFLGLVIIILSVFVLVLQKEGTPDAPVTASPQASTSTDRLIESLQSRLKVRPNDTDSSVQLGSAYLQKARETGNPAFYSKSEEVLLSTLETNPTNAEAMTFMGALALGRHDFREGWNWASRSLEIEPQDAETYGVLGDAQIELGLYDDAAESFQSMVDIKPNLDSYARASYARELAGDLGGAIDAMKLAVKAGGPGTENTAWSRVQLGKLYFGTGLFDEAMAEYEAALKDFGGYYLALAAMGDVFAAQGKYEKAIDYYGKSVDVIPMPTTLATLGDLYTKVGDTQEARLQYDTVEIIAKLGAANGVIYNRELARYYADHDINLNKALELARAEIEVRKDIYGYDTLAWVLFKNGHLDEAAEAMADALRLGTQDADLYYHAGMIHHGLGEYEQAREYLDRALALNPQFSVLQADVARATRDNLVRELAVSNSSVESTR